MIPNNLPPATKKMLSASMQREHIERMFEIYKPEVLDRYDWEVLTRYTPKGYDLTRLARSDKLPVETICIGAKGSSKTESSLEPIGMQIMGIDDEFPYLLTGKTLVSLQRNLLVPLRRRFGADNVSWNTTKKTMQFFGKEVWIEGANDERAYEKIQGSSLGGAACDELVQTPESYYQILRGSCRLAGAKILNTTNPDMPAHYVKRNIIDKMPELNKNKRRLAVYHFGLNDNHFLTPDFVESIKLQYTGVYWKRYIKGLWAAASGAIYEDFSIPEIRRNVIVHPSQIPLHDIAFSNVGVDIGGAKSGSAFVHSGFSNDMTTLYVLGEKFFKDQTATPTVVNTKFYDFMLNQRRMPQMIYFESAETYLKNGLREFLEQPVYKKDAVGVMRTVPRLPVEVRGSIKGSVNDRIRFIQFLMKIGKLKISSDCNELINALDEAVWNPKILIKDERLDDGTFNVDVLDAFEYSFESQMSLMRGANNFAMAFEDDKYNYGLTDAELMTHHVGYKEADAGSEYSLFHDSNDFDDYLNYL